MNLPVTNRIIPKISFNGYKAIKDNTGTNNYEFSYPFDSANYDCYLELFNVAKDRNGNYFVTDLIENLDTPNGILKLNEGTNKVDLESNYLIDKNTPFAYHYKLYKKGTDIPTYRVDSGDVIDFRHGNEHEIYNLVTQTGSKLSHGGSMKLVVMDNYNPGYVYNNELFNKKNILKDEKILKNARNSYKNFSNKIGGTLAGLEKSIEDGKLDGYSSIISLPLFTDDSLSAHGYWNKNCMQMIQSLGNLNNYASLQRKMFAKGMNFVSDGAFVNEGLEGVHFANVLKWGEKSPYFNWFKASGLKSDTLKLGVFGKNKDNVTHKIINSPYKYTQKENGIVKISHNSSYDSKKPTYVQIFDKRFVTSEQAEDTKNLIKSYEILNTDNPYDVNTHDDTVINYHFEIDPEIYNKNVLNLNEYNKKHDVKINLNDIDGTRFVNKFENFELEDKIEGNFETWDANTDIAKLNYVYSHADSETGINLRNKQRAERNETIARGNAAVRDYVITSGMYWTQKTKDILTLHTAQNLRNLETDSPIKVYNTILKNVENNIFPKRLTSNLNESVVENVLNGSYETNRKFSSENYSEQIKMGLMNFPLDSIELGDNIVGVLASPYISKRASNNDEVGLTRYDVYKNGNPNLLDEYRRSFEHTNKMYENEMSGFAKDILKMVENDLKDNQKLSLNDEPTLYGKYVLPLLTEQIAKFAVIKALQPNAKVFIDDNSGEIGYDYNALKEVSLQTVGIYGSSPEDEALTLVSKIRSGINKISSKDKKILAEALAKSLKGTSAESFALADMIVDRSESGLDWRIDATKDVADIDALRDGKNNFIDTWQEVTDFWKKFNDKIYEINPNAYMVAEVTDERGLHSIGNGGSSRIQADDIIRKLLNETGLTATANYSSFFTDVAMMFGKKFEYDKNNMDYPVNNYFQKRIFEKMIGGENYLRSSNLNSLLYSYTFIGNHDKPRALHCFALDMEMFFADLTKCDTAKDYAHRERAYRILNDRLFGEVDDYEVNNYNYSKVSPKAIAMADALVRGFGNKLEELAEKDSDFKNNKDAIYSSILKSISDLAKGQYMGKTFEADAFAVKPFDVVIDTVIKQAKEKYRLPLGKNDIEKYKNEVFKAIVDPAFSKLLGAMKYLVALPGKPTLYAGDDLGATGYDEKTKNIYLQNRAYIHNEWLNEKGKEFVAQHYQELNDIMALRSRSELDALNNGAPFTLPLQHAYDGTAVSAILRHNTDGKMAISLFNTAGINHEPSEYYSPQTLKLGGIKLSSQNDKIGLAGGLKEGAKFVNAQKPDDIYYVHKYNDEYILEHHDRTPVEINDSTMILYHIPEKSQVSFTGSVNYKPQFEFISKMYKASV